jgi:copper chaperone CopZ
MEALKFKTTIKCSGCVAAVTPFLNDAAGVNNWEVDTDSKDKVLSISGDGSIGAEVVIKAVQDAGYKAEQIN